MLSCRVLGPTELGAGRAVLDLGGPLPRRLITALIAAGGRPVGGDALTAAVWGDEPPASPEVSLQAYVSRLRRALGSEHRDALQRVGDGYRLTGAETDVAAFEAGVARGRELLDGQRPAEAVRAFDAALRLWRGEAFADLDGAAEVEAARARLEELRLVAVEERLAARLAVGDAPGAVAELTPAVRTEPYRERRWELLILGLYRSARQAEALSALREVRALLADDLGVDPGPALQSLERRLLAQDPGLLLPAGPDAAPRPLASAPAVTRPLSAFVGRQSELAPLAATMPAARLLAAAAHAGEPRQNWIAAMSELLLARAWLVPADPDPAAALRELGSALGRFQEEDDVGNVLACLHTGAYALTLSGRPELGATLLAAVRHQGDRRGLRPEATDPATAAALDAALGRALDPAARAAADADGAEPAQAAMIALLVAGQEQSHARR